MEYIGEIGFIYLKDIEWIINSKLLHYLYNIDSKNLKKLILNKFNIKDTKFSHYRSLDGILYKSNGEYEIALFLKEKNINFVYEKQYDINNKYPFGYRFDFYLIDYDFYIEYAGLLKESDSNETFNKIRKEYKKRIFEKEKFLLEKKYNYIISANIKEIKEKIENLKKNH